MTTSTNPKSSKTRLVFFGSGPVAAKSLSLLSQDFDIEAVITKPRAPHHRGDVPVLDVAEKLGLPIHLSSNKLELDELFTSAKFSSKVAVLIDFGIIVSQKVIDYFPLGIVNSHFSLLPEWRGADPITFAVLSGQPRTGVSLMLLVEKMDEGPLLAYGECDLPTDITTPKLTDDLINLSYALLVDAVPKYLAGELKPTDQSITGAGVCYSKKLSKADGVLDFAKPAEVLEREVRAYAGWPKSSAEVLGNKIIVIKARVATSKDDGELVLPAKDSFLEIKELIAPSGRRISGADYNRGYKKS